MQLMGVYLAITFLEYGLNSQTLGVDGQRWVFRLFSRCVSALLETRDPLRFLFLCCFSGRFSLFVCFLVSI